MANQKEEWQSTDSGYLNCIGVGDTYVKRQMERILNSNTLNAQEVIWWYGKHFSEINVNANKVKFVPRDSDNLNSK